MIKKIILSLMIFIGIFFIGDISFADSTNSNDFTSTDFTIPSSNFNFGSNSPSGTTSENLMNNTMELIISKLMIGLSLVSFVIITIGGYYMVAYHGDDSTLTKGKNIVKAGIISLIVALSSYYIINLIIYVLY